MPATTIDRRTGNARAAWRILFAVTAIVIALAATFPTTAAGGAQAPVTFTKDVAPILFTACAGCHRPSGSAPFSLLTYEDARTHAVRIADVTARRAMPPWKPEPGYGEFAGERRLTDAQVATLGAWVAQGAAEGDPAMLPPAPIAGGGWELGPPDLVVETPAYLLPAGGRDVYRNFVVPVPPGALGSAGDGIRYVRAWQFLPGHSHVVHHATMEFDTTDAARRRDADDPEPGFEGLMPHTVRGADGFFLGWTPGHTTYVAPPGMAWPLRAGTDLVMMLHLRPHDRPERVQAKLGLYFSDAPPSLAPTVIRLTRQDLDIPAGQSRYVATDSFRIGVDVDAYTVQPHAHYLARAVSAFAMLPDGTRRPLIHIRDWDFDWQGVYTYRRPVFLPAGTTLTMEYVYDNSAANPRNPHTPPQRVTYGQETTDEMAELWVQVVARRRADQAALTHAVQAKVVREDIVGLEKRLERDGTNTALHNDVALLYVAIGDLARAAGHFLDVLRIEPQSARAHYNLGNVLLGQGRPAAAADYLVKATALEPDYALAHDGLGLARRAEGKLEEAVAHHREAVRLNARDADAHQHLAAALRLLGRLDEAGEAYRRALEIDPTHPAARAELASVEEDLRRRRR